MLKARSDAFNADLLIVNHSLLISDIAAENAILPPHEVLVIDEAHHLRDVATRQLGFEIREAQLMDDLSAAKSSDGVLNRLVALATMRGGAEEVLTSVPDLQRRVVESSDSAVLAASRMFDGIPRSNFIHHAGRKIHARCASLGMTRITREWQQGVDSNWAQLRPELNAMSSALKSLLDLATADDQQPDAVLINANSLYERVAEVNYWLNQLIEEPDDNFVYWSAVNDRRDAEVQLNGAPLDVSEILGSHLFGREKTYVLTGATISDEGEFERLQYSLGFHADTTDTIESPFDFQEAALILVPEDIPQPNQPGYNAAVTKAVRDVAEATKGRTLALFTANSALNATRDELFNQFKSSETSVIGQGRDGPPSRVMQLLNDSDNVVALGAMSLWEGIDLPDASINSLIMTRLPFPVPRDPFTKRGPRCWRTPLPNTSCPKRLPSSDKGSGDSSDQGQIVGFLWFSTDGLSPRVTDAYSRSRFRAAR